MGILVACLGREIPLWGEGIKSYAHKHIYLFILRNDDKKATNAQSEEPGLPRRLCSSMQQPLTNARASFQITFKLKLIKMISYGLKK